MIFSPIDQCLLFLLAAVSVILTNLGYGHCLLIFPSRCFRHLMYLLHVNQSDLQSGFLSLRPDKNKNLAVPNHALKWKNLNLLTYWTREIVKLTV